MSGFVAIDGVLHAESVSLEAIARDFGTPCYVYSRAAMESAYRAYAQAAAGHDVLVCYAAKANSNLGVLNVLARLGAVVDVWPLDRSRVGRSWVGFQGRMEFGPRALGARSMLADALSPRMQKNLNLKIKYRKSLVFLKKKVRTRITNRFILF